MKAYLLLTATGALVILSTYDVVHHPELLKKLASHGVEKFVAYELSPDSVKARYGNHYEVVRRDIHESDDWRVVDQIGERIFKSFSFKELGEPIYYEPKDLSQMGPHLPDEER